MEPAVPHPVPPASPGARTDALRLPLNSSFRLIVALSGKLLEVGGADVTQVQAFAYANDVS